MLFIYVTYKYHFVDAWAGVIMALVIGFPIYYLKIRKISNLKSRVADTMETYGIQLGGNPSEWFGSFSPIDINRWIRAEVYREGEWVEYDVFEEE